MASDTVEAAIDDLRKAVSGTLLDPTTAPPLASGGTLWRIRTALVALFGLDREADRNAPPATVPLFTPEEAAAVDEWIDSGKPERIELLSNTYKLDSIR